MTIKSLGFALVAAATLGVAANASAFTLDFDGASSLASDYAPSGVTIGYGAFVPSVDGFGDPIVGSDHWELQPADPSTDPVPVTDPSTVGWGAAPSGSNALDARGGSVLLVFSTAWDLDSFTTILDNSVFGNLGSVAIEFYDPSYAKVGSITVDQTQPGFVASLANITNVKTIVLPGSALYDKIGVTPVPEPSTYGIVIGLGAIALVVVRRRRALRS